MKFRFAGVPENFLILCLGIFLFLLFFHPIIETEDVWWHLKTGQWIVDHFQVPHEDIFPFANEKIPWFCHEWLGSTVLYLVFKIGGFLSLKIFRAIFFMLMIGIFYVFSYRRLPNIYLIFLILLISYGLLQRPLLKPDTFNIFFVQLFLITLVSYEATGGRWKLFILLFSSVLWHNIHMLGAFVYGGAIISIFLLSAIIGYINQKNGNNSLDAIVNLKKQVKELTLTFLVYLGLFVINPYGIEGLLFPYKMFLLHQNFGFYKMYGTLSDCQPPRDMFFSLRCWYFLFLMGIPIVLLVLNNKRKFYLTILFIFALFSFFYMTRNSSFFTVVAAYVIVCGIQNISFTKVWLKMRWWARIDMAIFIVVAIFLIIQSIKIFNENIYYDGKRVKTLPLLMNPYVSTSINLIKENGITGPVFNDYILGGFIIWFDYPKLRPFADGRNVNLERFNDSFSILLKPELYWPIAERYYGFKIIIGTEGGSGQKFIKYINSQPDWQLIAVRGPLVIYVKRGMFRLPKELDKYEQKLKSVTITNMDIKQLKILSQRKQRTALDNLFNPSPFDVDMFFTGEMLMDLGYKGAAVKNYIGALKVSDRLYMQEVVAESLKQLTQE